MESPPVVTLYTRVGCHLCDEAKQVLETARRGTDFVLEVIDIDQDTGLRKLYNEEVPVVTINGRKSFKYRVDGQELFRKLAAAK
jgi:glutaredoxin